MKNIVALVVVTALASAVVLMGHLTSPGIAPSVRSRAVISSPQNVTVASNNTRLVSCGGRGAILSGNDHDGGVTLPNAATTACTIVFDRERADRSCVVNGGTILRLTTTDLVVSNIKTPVFTYTCE